MANKILLNLSSLFPTQLAAIYVVRVKYLLLEYQNLKSNVSFIYLNVIFTTRTWVSLGIYWSHATNHTSIMFDFYAITYSRLSIIDMCNVWFSSGDPSYLLNLQPVTMGVLIGAHSSILNFFNISLIYLVCKMNMPFLNWKNCK